jgi:two-component system sensor kinase FixL
MSTLFNQPLHAWPRDVAVALLYIAGYVLLDWVSYVQPIMQLGITPWNPQSGLTLTFLILCGPKRAPLVVVATILAERMIRGEAVPGPVLLSASVVIAAGYGLAAHLLRSGRLDRVIDSPNETVWFLTISAATTLAVAVVCVWMFTAAELLSHADTVRAVRRYWLGDLSGILTLTPPLLALARRRVDIIGLLSRRWELIAQLSAVMLILWLVFGWGRPETVRLFYLLFLPVLWVAFRWGGTGAALGTLAVQVGLVVTASAEAEEYPPVADLQLLMVTLESVGLLIGAVVMERAAALKQLAARDTEQRAILNTAPDGILSTGPGGRRILSANPAAADLFGVAQVALAGQDLDGRLPGIRVGSAQGRCSLEARRLDGSLFPVDVAWARIEAPAAEGYIFIVRDATERLSNESKLRERDTALARATRFAMLGELASAITHELNQPITALVSYLRAAQILAAPFGSEDPRLAQTLNKASNEAIRASGVLRRLRDFYRGGAPKLVALNLVDIIDATLKSFEDRLRQAGVRVETDLQSGLPPLQCDQTQVEMVLLNLLGNAIDALMQCPEGERRIRLATEYRGAEVLLAIEDSGPGLAPEVTDRLFDPFVTTKPDGMGLGLTISRSLLRSQGGDVWVRASRLGGACFVIRMPTTVMAQIAL